MKASAGDTPTIVDSNPNNPLFILTKMMRGADPEDLADIAFLLKHEPMDNAVLRAAFDRVRMPDILELRDAFHIAQPKVLALAKPQRTNAT